MNFRKGFLFLLFALSIITSYSQVKLLQLDGKNYGRNLILSNPFSPDGVGYSIKEIRINGKVPTIKIFGSVFEINFSQQGIPLNDSVHLRILHAEGSFPQIYNPECITEEKLEAIPSLDNTTENKSYYLKDKSLCIIKGRIISENKYDFEANYQLVLRDPKNDLILGLIPTDPNCNYVVVLHFDRQYELQISDYNMVNIKKRVLLDLRGVPEEKKKGELIYVNFTLPKASDARIENLNSGFPSNKLFYDPVSQSLKWDEDFATVLDKASGFLVQQINEEGKANKIELDRNLKLLEIAKNKSDLAAQTSEIEKTKSELFAKNFEIEKQNNTLIKQDLDKKTKESELLAKSTLIKDEQAKKKYLYAIIIFVLLVSIGSVFAFFRQRKLKRLVDVQKAEAEHQKQLVEEKQKEILDSIRYAKRIQKALITNENYIEKHLKRLMKK